MKQDVKPTGSDYLKGESLSTTESGSSSDSVRRSGSDSDDSWSNVSLTAHEEEEWKDDQKQGTMMSARVNLISSMVGGGSLSLPLAFSQAGIGFFAPLLLILSGIAAQFTIHALMHASSHHPDPSFESLARAAFGRYAKYACMGIVLCLCSVTTIGYGIILRDLARPISHQLDARSGLHHESKPTVTENAIMWIIVLHATPFCCLPNLTALHCVGVASTVAIGVVGVCIVYRSVECNFWEGDVLRGKWTDYVNYFPSDFCSVLDALPLIVSVFVCHFNAVPVYNELRNPTPKRVSRLLHSTNAIATVFYLLVGFFGAMYGNCTATGTVSGNILLDFNDDDKLIGVAKMCLGVTVFCMTPMLVTPARDILLQFLMYAYEACRSRKESSTDSEENRPKDKYGLVEPLLPPQPQKQTEEDDDDASPLFSKWDVNDLMIDDVILALTPPTSRPASPTPKEATPPPPPPPTHSFKSRFLAAVIVLWGGTTVACFVENLDTIWDLLGSSFSVLVGYLIPCGIYLLAVPLLSTFGRCMAMLSVVVFVPVLVLCTTNSVYNAFFAGDEQPADDQGMNVSMIE